MVRGRRLAEAFTPEGLHDRWEAMTLGARMFRDEVAQGQAEAETELRERFGLVPHGLPELVSAGAAPARGSAGPPGEDGSAPGPGAAPAPTTERRHPRAPPGRQRR